MNFKVGDEEFGASEVFIFMVLFFGTVAFCMIFNEMFPYVRDVGFILNVFFVSCLGFLVFTKIVLKPEFRSKKVNEGKYRKEYFLHPLFYHVTKIFLKFVLPVLVGLFFSGMIFKLSK